MDFLVFDLDLHVYIIIIITVFIATVMQQLIGMGFAIVFMSIMQLIFEYKLALALMFALYVIVIVLSVITVRKYMDFKIAWPCIIGNITGLIIGISLLEVINGQIIVKILGGFLILLSIYFIKFSGKIVIKPTVTKGISLGGLSGILAGLFGMGGPPVSIYLMNTTDNKFTYIATIQLSYMAGCFVGVFMHAFDGHFTPSVLGAMMIAIIPVALGAWLGVKLLKILKKEFISKCLYIFMIVMGSFLIIK